MSKYILFLFLFTLSGFSTAQVKQAWVSFYHGTGNASHPSAMCTDNAGNVYVTGISSSPSASTYNFTTIKYNTAGVQQWIAIYDRTLNTDEVPTCIAVDNSGNVFVAGSTTSGAGSVTDCAIVKYNSQGVEQWTDSYAGSLNFYDQWYAIAVDAFGNVFVTGYSSETGANYDCITAKYSPTGVREWLIKYNDANNRSDVGNCIAVDAQSNVYVGGYAERSFEQQDYLVLKYNSMGVQQWIANYNSNGSVQNEITSITLDNTGNVYVTGNSSEVGTRLDFATLKYNSSGIFQWVSRYSGPGNENDDAADIKADKFGNVYVTGTARVGANMNQDFVTIKYNQSGTEEWVRTFDGGSNGDDRAVALAIDTSGNVYVTGNYIFSFEGYVRTLKYNPAGAVQWSVFYKTNQLNGVKSIARDMTGNVFITCTSTLKGSQTQFTTIKYSQTVGINPISLTIPDNFSLLQNYPNPFNPNTVISFQLPAAGFTSLKVFDNNGREVSELVNENLNAGEYKINFNAGSFPSGVYYYKLTSENFSETKKMILVK